MGNLGLSGSQEYCFDGGGVPPQRPANGPAMPATASRFKRSNPLANKLDDAAQPVFVKRAAQLNRIREKLNRIPAQPTDAEPRRSRVLLADRMPRLTLTDTL